MTRILHASGYGGDIYTISFDEAAKSLTVTSKASAGEAPTWSLKHPKHDILYAGDEFAKPDGVIYAFSVAADGKLKQVGTTSSGGEGPVSLILSPSHDFLYVANYAGGTVSSVRLNKADGTFAGQSADQSIKFEGSGPNEERQEAPHAHAVALDPTGALLFVMDLGSDKLRVFLTGSELTRLADLDVVPGSGPRHAAFSTPLKVGDPVRMYLVNELANTVDVYQLEYPSPTSRDAGLKPVQLGVSTLPTEQVPAPENWTAAEVAFSPFHKHLIVSNRAPADPKPKDGQDLFAVYPLKEDGTLGEVEFVKTGGLGPRHFVVTKEHLLVGLQATNEVVLFAIEDDKIGKEVARVGGVEGVTWVNWL